MEPTVFLVNACGHSPVLLLRLLLPLVLLRFLAVLNSLGTGLESSSYLLQPLLSLLPYCSAQQRPHLLGTGLEDTRLFQETQPLLANPLSQPLGTGLEDATPLFVTADHPQIGA